MPEKPSKLFKENNKKLQFLGKFFSILNNCNENLAIFPKGFQIFSNFSPKFGQNLEVCIDMGFGTGDPKAAKL